MGIFSGFLGELRNFGEKIMRYFAYFGRVVEKFSSGGDNFLFVLATGLQERF